LKRKYKIMSVTTLDLRGRDLVIIPAQEWLRLPFVELLKTLFAAYLPAAVLAHIEQDKRHLFLRTKPIYFSAVKQALQRQQTPFTVAFATRPEMPRALTLAMAPRPYQLEALAAWLAEGSAGVVVLPTGAGKTFVAAMTIQETGLWTLAVVPTIDLLQQWRAALTAALSLQAEEIGVFGGGEKELKPITIITYDSAALYPRELRRFGLLIFDECHHLPAPTYRLIAESSFTPLRLGLSATPERSDMAHAELEELVGAEVYRRSPAELTEERYLAQYKEQHVEVALSKEDETRYAEQRHRYRSFLQRHRIAIRNPEDFQQKVIYRSARDPEARAAMLAWREARDIAMNAPAKYTEIERILRLHKDDQVILFSEYNYVVDEISRRFCIPSIMHYIGL
jgi:superfamily II DNA or RNA helicase